MNNKYINMKNDQFRDGYEQYSKTVDVWYWGGIAFIVVLFTLCIGKLLT